MLLLLFWVSWKPDVIDFQNTSTLNFIYPYFTIYESNKILVWKHLYPTVTLRVLGCFLAPTILQVTEISPEISDDIH